MKEIIKAIEGRAGVPLGERGERTRPFLEGLEDQHLPTPNRNWVYEARAGKTSGRVLYNSIEIALARTHNSAKKDKLYRRIATEAVSIRNYGTGLRLRNYISEHFTEEVAANLAVPDLTVNCLIRAMRADLVFSENDNLHPNFLQTVEEFLKAHLQLLPPSHRSKAIIRLSEEWDGRSSATFYRKLYQLTARATRSLGLWTPYEMGFMQHYYEDRMREGSQPTVLDGRTVKARTRVELDNLAGEISNETGVLVDRVTLNLHRNALVYGKPIIGT